MTRKISLFSFVLLPLLALLLLANPKQHATDPADPAQQLRQADGYARDGQFDRALALYRQVLAEQAGSQQAFESLRALVYLNAAIGETSEAEIYLTQMLGDFVDHQRLPHAVHEIVEKGAEYGALGQIRELYMAGLEDQMAPAQDIWLLMGVSISSGLMDDPNTVYDVMTQLTEDYGDDTRVTEAFGQMAWSHRKNQKYEQAKEVYQYVVDNWPERERAVFSQRGIILCELALGNTDAAWTAVEKLITDFADYPHASLAVKYVAEHYRDLMMYSESRSLHEHVVVTWPDSPEAIWSQRGIILCNIALGDETATDAAIDTLFDVFAGWEEMPKVIYQIARKLSDDEKKAPLFRYVIDGHAGHDMAVLAQANIVNIHIRAGQFQTAEDMLNDLLAASARHPILPKAVAIVGDGYYAEGLRYDREDRREEAVWYYEKATVECIRIVHDLPEITYTTAEACYFAGVCLQRIGDYDAASRYYQMLLERWPDFEYAWNALFQIARMHDTQVKEGSLSVVEADPVIAQAYQTLLRQYPTCQGARHAKRWLNRYYPHML